MSAIAVTCDRVLSAVGEVIRIALPPRTRDDPEGARYGDLALVASMASEFSFSCANLPPLNSEFAGPEPVATLNRAFGTTCGDHA